jgi:hypothetical protein
VLCNFRRCARRPPPVIAKDATRKKGCSGPVFADCADAAKKYSGESFKYFFLLTRESADCKRVPGCSTRFFFAGIRPKKNIFKKPLTFPQAGIF